MPDSPESEVNELQSESNTNAPPGQLDTSRLERSAENETERIRRLTEQAQAIAGAAGTGSANTIMSPSEGSDGSKMGDDNLTADEQLLEKIHDQRKRIARTEAALAATTVLNEFTDSFPSVTRKALPGVLIPSAPLFLLKPQQQRSGAKAIALHPGPVSLAAITGIKFAEWAKSAMAERRSAIADRAISEAARFEIDIIGYPARLPVGGTQRFKTNAPDPSLVKWESNRPDIADVDPHSGEVTAKAVGVVDIIARSDVSYDKVVVAIEKPPEA